MSSIRKGFLWVLSPVIVLCVCAVLFFHSAGQDKALTVGVFSGSYWGTPTGNSYQILDDAIARFQREHPGVKVEYTSGISPREYSEWLSGKLLTGKDPDVYFVFPEDFNLLASSGALLPLDKCIEEDDAFDSAVYYDACLSAGQSDGTQYALPYESVPTLMFVNKTLLQRFGVEKPDNNWTWDDFYHICQQVSAGTSLEDWNFGFYDYTWENALYSNGTTLFSEDGKSCSLGDSGVQEAVQFYKSLCSLNPGHTVTAKDFDLGRVAFRPFLFSEYKVYQPYPWRVKKYSNFEWDCVKMPAGPNGGNVSETQTMLLGISSRSRKKQLAWEFLKLLSADEAVQRELYTYSQGISPVRSVAEDETALSELFRDTPGSSSFNRDVIHEIMSTAVSVSRFNKYDQAITMARSAVSAALESDQSLESQLLTARREINVFLSQ